MDDLTPCMARRLWQFFSNYARNPIAAIAGRAGPSSARSANAFESMLSALVLTIAASCFSSGCTWHQPRQQAMPWHSSDAQAVVVMPAQDAMRATQTALTGPPLSLPIDSVKDGVIITGWKEYPGDVHIVRRWYERTRFRITVTRDFLHPETDSRISVEDQTMERATDVQPWYNAPNTSRPQRSAEVLKQIIAQLRPGKST